MDDQPANLALVRQVLGRAGVTLREARSGSEALAMVQESAPDLVLLDMHLPDMHGLEVLRRLRASPGGTGVRVIAMSAAVTPEDRARWLEAGCVSTIEKPFELAAFREEIARWLSGAAPARTETAGATAGKRDGLGDILLANALITPEQFSKAVAVQQQSGRRLGQVLVDDGALSEDDLAWALSSYLGYPYVFLTRDIIDVEAVRLLPEAFLRERRILPILKSGDELRVAMADPTDQSTVDEVRERTGLEASRALALASNISEMLDHFFSRAREASRGREETAPGARELQFHLVQALRNDAAEVHFDTGPDGQGRVRYRLQGALLDRAGQRADLHAAILRHLRDLTGFGESLVGTAQTTAVIDGVETHLAVSFVPTMAGPAATVTLRPMRTEVPELTTLGIDPRHAETLLGMMNRTRGLILVGCADAALRSTLLHGAIRSGRDGKIWTLETFPGYRRPTLNQTAVASGDQMAVCLESAAKAGADLIVADDVSRREALIAAEEIAGGRLVAAGHPRDDTVALLSDLLQAVGPARAGSTLLGLVLARTVRLLCPDCKETLPQPAGPATGRTCTAPGCRSCSFTGFRGVRVLAETWLPDDDARGALRAGDPQTVMRRLAKGAGAMREQAMALVREGLTSADEAARIAEGL